MMKTLLTIPAVFPVTPAACTTLEAQERFHSHAEGAERRRGRKRKKKKKKKKHLVGITWIKGLHGPACRQAG